MGLERQYKVCNFGLKAVIRWSQHAKRDPLVTQGDLSAPRVCSPAIVLLHKKGPRHRRKICANSRWLYSYYTQSSPSKNKNMNYILYIYESFVVCPAVQYTTFGLPISISPFKISSSSAIFQTTS